MNFTVTSYGNIFCVSIDDDYDPDTLTIKKGSTVIWINDDNSLHTVTEDDDEFDSGSISPGNTWSYTFNTVGTYDYYDQYDDDLDGQIIVLVSYKPTATISSISPQIAELDNSGIIFEVAVILMVQYQNTSGYPLLMVPCLLPQVSRPPT